jgi:enoyl-CoA hydratase
LKREANYIIEKQGCIAVILINNPPQNFILTPEFIPVHRIRKIADEKDIKGMVISGSGRHFSAGAGLDELFILASNENKLNQEMGKGMELLTAISNLNIPVIAAVSGACFGGGLEIALSCHMRFSTPTAVFAFPEVLNNLMPGLGGIFRINKKIGTSLSVQTLLSGDIISAEKALSIGVVDNIPGKNVLEFSVNYLQQLLDSKPKEVIVSIMEALANAATLPMEDALRAETRLFCQLAAKEIERRKK